MAKNNFAVSILVDKSLQEAFDAINDVTGWWTENTTGNSKKENDEFEVRFGDVHYSKQKLVEVIPNKRITWLITDSKLNFIKDKSEWTGTKVIFDIEKEGDKTKITFIHAGLIPEIECYNACSNAWSGYIQKSLKQLIMTGKGKPEVLQFN
jgi:hypothetical protein